MTIQKNELFATPDSMADLMAYLMRFNGSERVAAMTAAGMAMNLASSLEAAGKAAASTAPHTITVQLTFNPNNCVDVDADGYDLDADLDAIMGFGAEHYNLEDWNIVQ